MVVSEQFPIFRLATLLARQVSAPVAAKIKKYARGHPVFERVVCARVARVYRGAELRLKLWSLRLPQPRHLPPLSDTEALDVGADILGEAVVFGLGSSIVIFEVNRQMMKQEAKVEEKQAEWMALLARLRDLGEEVRRQQLDLDSLPRALDQLLASTSPAVPTAPRPQTS